MASSLRFGVMIMLVLEWCCFACLEQERHALLTLKANMNYPYNVVTNGLRSWVTESTLSCCEWERVECNNSTGHVTRLYLASTRDVGDGYFNGLLFLPFKELRNLDLSKNGIRYWLENEGKLFNPTNYYIRNMQCWFETLSTLGNLEVLDLTDNHLNNSVLPSLSELPSLKYLSLAQNWLGGSNHSDSNSGNWLGGSNHSDSFGQLAGLRNLEVLDLNGNSLNRTIQSLIRLDDFVSLKSLDLSSNRIQRFKLNQGLLSLSNLENLFLGGSCLGKNFLRSINGVLASLKVLSLPNCCLSTLPTQGWCELRNLQELDLSGNQLQGFLPPCLGNLTYLRVLDLSDNELAGNIASSPLITLTSLVYLSLSSNRFQVPVSFRSFVNHSNLKVIFVDDNIFLAENESTAWAPKFQLNFFSLSNGTKHSSKHSSSIAFPSFLYYQNDLRIVQISHSMLNETFPCWLLENNARLEGLYLRDNFLVGPLMFPSHPHLNILAIDISNNKIRGRIPSNISSIFPNLNEVRMFGNELEGNLITHLFHDMDDLWFIDLSDNHLSGVLPDYLITRCASLKTIRLSNNNLSGILSPRVFNLTILDGLYLDGNNFTGDIPESLSLLSLMTLDLSANHFSGDLPSWMGNMSYLRELMMRKNHFHGSIPMEFCLLEHLLFLDLSDNSLSGPMPSCSNLLDLGHLNLRRNMLEGPLPSAFVNSSFLITLDLSENYLSGIIPTWINSLSSLTILLLKSNSFQGEFPSQLCQLDRLAVLDISQNNLSGYLPPCLGKINRLETNDVLLHVGAVEDIRVKSFLSFMNSIMLSQTGKDFWLYDTHEDYGEFDLKQVVTFTTKWNSFSYSAKILIYLSGIDLSSNQFTSEIPPEIGTLSHIHALNLSHNKFTGSIPATFSNLSELESLDLSYNNLKGKIPYQLVELFSLEVFNVAHNNLSGEIPREEQFATFDNSSYEGNPLLCGHPSHNSCNNIGAPVPNFPKNWQEEDSLLDLDAFYWSFVASYLTVLLGIVLLLYINPHWRRAWFNLIEVCLTESYYFLVDNFDFLLFRNM